MPQAAREHTKAAAAAAALQNAAMLDVQMKSLRPSKNLLASSTGRSVVTPASRPNMDVTR
jgi:hypothetical protein